MWKRRVLLVSCASSLLAASFERTGSGKNTNLSVAKPANLPTYIHIQKTKLDRLEVVVSKIFIFTPEPGESDPF